jgi:hypothetical protein
MTQKSPENKLRFRGLKLNQTHVSLHPSFIQTLTVGLGVSPSHASSCWRQGTNKDLLVGYTTDRELHPAPKVFIWLLRLYPSVHKLHNSLADGARGCASGYSVSQFALTMQSTGQTVTHLGES